MMPIAPSEVAARVNFALVDIVKVGSGDGEAPATRTCKFAGRSECQSHIEGRAWAPRLGGHHQHPPVANNH
jgi:hypothetical protein